jgi:hypothetical protein
MRLWRRPDLEQIEIEIQKIAVYVSDFICDGLDLGEGKSFGKPVFRVFAGN